MTLPHSTLLVTMYAVKQAERLGYPLTRDHYPCGLIDWLRTALPDDEETYATEVAELCARGLVEWDGIDEWGSSDYLLTSAGLGYVSRRLREQGFHPTKLRMLE